ncbi:MAG: tyrosine-type recombinase/integrase [Erysipelotrichaceae bacterium]|nr:tyrosine-type recombinase/integrase [Erysipelotrichaceae bacterium]
MKKTNKEALEVANYVSDFLRNYVPTYKTGSSHTIKTYKITFSLFLSFLEEEKKESIDTFNWNSFSKENIEDFMKWLDSNRSNLSSTINIRLGCLREFLKYVSENNIDLVYLYQQAKTIKKRKTPKRKVNGMTKEAIQTLMSMPDTSTSIGIRDLTMMIVLYATAARIDELLSIRIKDLHLKDKKPYVGIVGKGNKVRSLYLPQKAVKHLNHYLFLFHCENPDEEEYVFYANHSYGKTKITQPAFAKRLKLYAKEANKINNDVPIELHSHQFRHARASHWLDEGMNIVQISFLLGHEQLQTTMVYLDITAEEELNAYNSVQDEVDKNVSPKWKNSLSSLLNACGV